MVEITVLPVGSESGGAGTRGDGDRGFPLSRDAHIFILEISL